MLTKVIRHGYEYWEAQPAPKAKPAPKPTIAELMANAPAFQSTGAEPANETLAPAPSAFVPPARPVPLLPSRPSVKPPLRPLRKSAKLPSQSVDKKTSPVEQIARIQTAAMVVFQVTAEEFRDSNCRQAVWSRIASICVCIEKLGDRGADRSAIAAAHLRDPAVVTRAPQKFFKWKRQIPAFAQQVQALKTQLVQPQAQNEP